VQAWKVYMSACNYNNVTLNQCGLECIVHISRRECIYYEF